ARPRGTSARTVAGRSRRGQGAGRTRADASEKGVIIRPMGRRALLMTCGLLAAACGDEEAARPSADAPSSEAIVREGEALYARYCALCHGADAEGYAADDAPSLRSPELLRSASDAYLTAAIADGR